MPAVHVAAHDLRGMDSAVGSTDDRRLLALAYLAPLRANVSISLDDDGSPLCDEQAGDDAKLLGVYCSDAAAQARIESARTLPGFSDEAACFHITLYTPRQGRMDRRLLHCRMRGCRMRRRAVVPYATATSGQPLPYLPLPMARIGVPADAGRTALPIFETGTRRRGVLCGSAPTLYSSQVQQQARIPAHHGEPLRTNERLLTCSYAATQTRVPVSGGQGVAGSNPAVPTA